MAFWDKQEVIGTVEKNKAENINIEKCELKGKDFVVVSLLKKIDDEYKPIKNIPIPATEDLKEVLEAVIKLLPSKQE